jgi:O-antigen biosynthesis protein
MIAPIRLATIAPLAQGSPIRLGNDHRARSGQAIRLAGDRPARSGQATAEALDMAGNRSPSHARPLVSCIMATRNRPQFVRQALRSFYRQSYRRCELIVIDDGETAVRDLCDGLPRVRYIRLERPTPTGTKLNIGAECAAGAILQKFDDDDYYGAAFIETAVGALAAAADDAIIVWDCFVILMAGERRPRFSGHGWTAGGTLCFRREVWQQTAFRDYWKGCDSQFLRDRGAPIVAVCEPELYLLVRHGANTWTEMGELETDAYFRSLPVYETPLELLVDGDALTFYQELQFAQTSGST